MAYIQTEEDKNKQLAGEVLAGSGGIGAKRSAGTPGSGFVNLENYLQANRGQGTDMANTITQNVGNTAKTQLDLADQAAKDWASGAQSQVSQAANPIIQGYQSNVNTYQNAELTGSPNTQLVGNYGGPTNAGNIAGLNDLSSGYQKASDIYGTANDYGTQQAALKSKHGYGSGFAGLDTVLARKESGGAIDQFVNQNQAGLKQGDQFKGVAAAQGTAQSAIDKALADIASGKSAENSAAMNFQKRQGNYFNSLIDGGGIGEQPVNVPTTDPNKKPVLPTVSGGGYLFY